MKNIDQVIFDFGGVFLEVDYHATRAAFEKLGVSDFESMYSQANANTLFQDLEKGLIDESEFYKRINETCGLQLNVAQIQEAWNAMLGQYRESSVQFLKTLKDRYKLYLFSNTNIIHMAQFRQKFRDTHEGRDFDSFFTRSFYSCDMKLRKPDIESFEWIIDELGIDPTRTLFIDDSRQNIEAAAETGMQTILLEPGVKVEDLNW